MAFECLKVACLFVVSEGISWTAGEDGRLASRLMFRWALHETQALIFYY